MATIATAASDRIADLLVREGMIAPEQLSVAVQDARANNTRVGYSLIKLGMQQAQAERALFNLALQIGVQIANGGVVLRQLLHHGVELHSAASRPQDPLGCPARSRVQREGWR